MHPNGTGDIKLFFRGTLSEPVNPFKWGGSLTMLLKGERNDFILGDSLEGNALSDF